MDTKFIYKNVWEVNKSLLLLFRSISLLLIWVAKNYVSLNLSCRIYMKVSELAE